MVLLLEPELPGDLLLGRLVVVQVQAVQRRQRLLGVPVLGVGHPAARLNLGDYLYS